MSDKNITVYSANWCPYCHQAENYLRARNIAFSEIDIDAQPEKYELIKQRLGDKFFGLPIIIINETILQGFDKTAIDMALNDEL
ncbi:MAG: NrdH-redoxin [Candidatus Nomurabacteria bacterium]|nr:NrdH-redoxin [Candidatus Nomurabacteria bacterium]